MTSPRDGIPLAQPRRRRYTRPYHLRGIAFSTVAFQRIDVLDIDVQVQMASCLPAVMGRLIRWSEKVKCCHSGWGGEMAKINKIILRQYNKPAAMPLKVAIVLLGNLKYPLDIVYLERWKSSLFSIKHSASAAFIEEPIGRFWHYPDNQLINILREVNDSDVTVGVINSPLEDNYYMRRISKKLVILSMHEMADIIRDSNFSLEHYVIRCIYEIVAIYKANNSLIPQDVYSWAHSDVRGCIFDLNAFKTDIIFSMHQPKLCEYCRSRLASRQIDAGFFRSLDKELPKIKKALYYSIGEWVQQHPIGAIIIASLFTVLLGLLSNLIFELSKTIFYYK